ncbi:hypothetical protein KY346_04345 [Candidatus Woesearchaeota archaeon]|nr:hypothetical protein [Candidatus Woesearchaeota archaeon]
MKLVRFAVLVMSFLLIMLPVCYAQKLDVTTFSGKDGVQGYARPDDEIVMNIEAIVPFDLAISPSQVQVCKENICANAASCTPGKYIGTDVLNTCVYQETLEGETGISSYLVNLLDDDKKIIKTEAVTLHIDRQPPVILLLDIQQKNETIDVQIHAQDFGPVRGNTKNCAGIKKIDFYDGTTGNILNTNEYGYENCDVIYNFEYLLPQGRFELCAKATDMFNQESAPVCKIIGIGKEIIPVPTEEVLVYEPGPEEGVDFYTITGTSIYPRKGFDRRAVNTIPVPVYIQVMLKQKQSDSDVSIYDKSVQCSSEDISESYLVAGTDATYVVVKSLPTIAERTSPVEVDCTLQLQIRKGQKIFTDLETEKFSKKIPVYNNPLGTISENAESQIGSLDDDIWDLQKRTNRISDINDWLATIVTIVQTIAQGDVLLNYVGAALWLVSVVLYELKSVPYVGPALEALAKVFWKVISCELINNFFHEGILGWIWNPGMVGTEVFSMKFGSALKRIVSTLSKTVSIIYSCQLCDYSSALYSGTKKTIYGDTTLDIEDKRGKPTVLETFTVYDWDPYRSIHVAMGCLCLPGIVYNMRKEVQINCIYRNCVKQNAELGLPFDNCQQTFKEQTCLYVDGAAWRVSGETAIAPLFSSLLTMILEQLPIMLASRGWSMLCDPDCGMFGKKDKKDGKKDDCSMYGLEKLNTGDDSAYPEECSDDPSQDWAVPMCGVWGATLILQEIDYFGTNKYSWDRFTAELEGEDYCD